jgi:hypothetical protein
MYFLFRNLARLFRNASFSCFGCLSYIKEYKKTTFLPHTFSSILFDLYKVIFERVASSAVESFQLKGENSICVESCI